MIPSSRSRSAALRRRATAAFTIMEVAMATFVMAFGITSSIVALQSGFKAIDVARGTTLAAQIIQSEMERLRMMPWNKSSTSAVDSILELSTATDTTAPIPSGSPAGVDVAKIRGADVVGRYTITRTVEDNADHPGEAKDITVTVRWQSYDNRWHQRSITALYCQNGLYDYYYTVAHP